MQRTHHRVIVRSVRESIARRAFDTKHGANFTGSNFSDILLAQNKDAVHMVSESGPIAQLIRA